MNTPTTTKVEDGYVKSFRDWIKADGSTEFKPEAERYHLYVQYLCPFAHRAILGHALKGLQDVISMDVVDWELSDGDVGWKFNPQREGCDEDSQCGASTLREIYDLSAKKLGATGFNGKTTVPTLYDKKLGRVVSTESADILRMLNSEFNEFCATDEQKKLDLYPDVLRDKIDEVECWTQRDIVLAVYTAFFSKSQEQYDQGILKLYGGLEKAEELLSKQRFLAGDTFTEADIRLFTPLIRYDVAYVQYMNARRRLIDYPALWGYTRDIYQMPYVKDTVKFDHIVKGYFSSYNMKHFNPYSIIPALPVLDYNAPSGRETMSS